MASPWPRPEGRASRAEWWQTAPCQQDRVWWTTEQPTREQHSTLLQKCSRVFLGAALTLWQHLAIEALGSRGWGQKQSRAPQVFPKLQSHNTSGLVTQVNAQAAAALFPQNSSSPHQGEAPSNSVLLQKSHISDSAFNTKFLTLAGDAKWLTGVVIWGLQWCLLLLEASLLQSPRLGLEGVRCCLWWEQGPWFRWAHWSQSEDLTICSQEWHDCLIEFSDDCAVQD